VLTLKCPHCFVPLILRDRTLVNRRTVCPKCEELMHLAADPDRVVVGLLPSRHNAHALTVYGVLDFPEDAPLDPHAASAVSVPARVELTLEEVLAKAPPVEPRRPLQAIDFPMDEPVELTDIAKGTAVKSAPRTGKPAQKKRAATPPTTEASKPHAVKPVAGPRPSPATEAASQAVASRQTVAKEARSWDRLQSALEGKPWFEWVRQNRVVVGVAGVLALLLIFQLIWMVRGSGDGPAAAAPASTSNAPSSAGSPPAESAADPTLQSSSDEKAAGQKNARNQENDPLADALPPPAGDSDGEGAGPDALPDAVLNRPDAPAVAEVPKETPTTIIVAPEKPKRDPIDVAARLRQPLASFDQARPATARSLFETLEEMIGVPVLLDAKDLGPSAAALDQKLTLKLKSTTVADLLTAVADRTGLQWQIDGETIRVKAKATP
jgi:hypothetical protein